MPKPLITVIVPVYNEEKFIDRCVESIVKQTYDNIELILIDGGSIDKSASIVDNWEKDWNKKRIDALKHINKSIENVNPISVIHTENKGVSASRNIGIDKSHGEYITFIDGDDWIENESIERLFDAMQSESTDMVSLQFVSCYDDNMTSSDNGKEIKTGLNNMMSAFFVSNNIMDGDVHCWGRLYKKELLKDISFREGLSIGEDMLFLIEYVRKCRQITVLEYEGYNYYRNPSGAMTKPFTVAAMDQIRCFREVENLLGLTDKLRKNMLIAIMLTAGRIAVLPTEEWKNYSEQICELSSTLKEYKNASAMKLLDRGYKIKVFLFSLFPKMYLKLYHSHKQ